MSEEATADERLDRVLEILERILPVMEKLLRHPMLARWIK